MVQCPPPPSPPSLQHKGGTWIGSADKANFVAGALVPLKQTRKVASCISEAQLMENSRTTFCGFMGILDRQVRVKNNSFLSAGHMANIS